MSLHVWLTNTACVFSVPRSHIYTVYHKYLHQRHSFFPEILRTQRRTGRLLRRILSRFIISYTVSEIMLPAARAPGAVTCSPRLPHLSTVFFSLRPFRSGARFSGQDL